MMPKLKSPTFAFLADIVSKDTRAVEQYFLRKGWSINEPEHVKQYLIKFL